MMILDANVWIAFLYEDDALHKKAEKIFELDKEIIGIPEYVIIEVSSVLSQKAGKKIANDFLEMIMQSKDVEVMFADDQFFMNAASVFKKHQDRKLSFIDYSLLYLSEFYEIVTFDKNLQRAIRENTNC